MSSPITLSGSCLCGGVKYRVAGHLLTAVNCHCSMCRKAHGAAFRSGAIVKMLDLSWVQGESLVADYRSSEQIHRLFCRTCGSHLLARSDLHPAIASIAVGTLDGDLPFGIAQHWNVASKASWFEITDDLPQHAVVPAPPAPR
jgi:hypothetical protein